MSEWKPLCTTCAFPAEHVYTTYSSASNIRLAVCPHCNAFVDPLIESPPLYLALDLVLLKPRVFLHLLFNRGSPPRIAGEAVAAEGVMTVKADTEGATSSRTNDKGPPSSSILSAPTAAPSRAAVVHRTLLTLTLATLLAELAVRLLARPGARVLPTLARAAAELGAQLAVSALLAMVILTLGGWYPAKGAAAAASAPTAPALAARDGRQHAFLPALVPLTLLYTALIPLLLQLALGIWYPSAGSGAGAWSAPPTATPETAMWPTTFSVLGYALPPQALRPVLQPVSDVCAEMYAASAAAWASDPVWAGTRLLGGMSAGFGLRVLLPTRPWETTAIVLAGWSAAGFAGRWLERVL